MRRKGMPALMRRAVRVRVGWGGSSDEESGEGSGSTEGGGEILFEWKRMIATQTTVKIRLLGACLQCSCISKLSELSTPEGWKEGSAHAPLKSMIKQTNRREKI
eukprot:1156265-Pelagomonas_calceolata.AAC.5